MARLQMDWLRLETKLREELRAVENGTRTAGAALVAIDAILAHETRRGNELSRETSARLCDGNTSLAEAIENFVFANGRS